MQLHSQLHRRFGSLVAANDRIGYPTSRRQGMGAARNVQNRGWLADRYPKFTDEELLSRLSDLLAQHSRLTDELINASPDMPHSKIYRRRFGPVRPRVARGPAPNWTDAPPRASGGAQGGRPVLSMAGRLPVFLASCHQADRAKFGGQPPAKNSRLALMAELDVS